MARGGTKPPEHSRRAERFKDGQKKGGGAGSKRHAGPKRASKTPPKVGRGAERQQRKQP
jgi:hypothetical protein